MQNVDNEMDRPSDKPEGFKARLRWGSAKELETFYVNHISVTRTENEYYIIFGELPMPIITLGERPPEELEIIPKVRLAISPGAMESIVGVIQSVFGPAIESEEE